MQKITAKLDATQAQAKFPDIKGLSHVRGAKLFGDHVALVDMGRGAKAVIVNGAWDCCCPNEKQALIQVDAALSRVARHLSGQVRC